MAPDLLQQLVGGIYASPAAGERKKLPFANSGNDPQGSLGLLLMIRLTLTGLILIFMSATILAETAIITEGWVQLHEPSLLVLVIR